MKDINEINNEYKLDLILLNQFLLKENDDLLDILLLEYNVIDYKEIDINNIESFNKFLNSNPQLKSLITRELWDDKKYRYKLISNNGLMLEYVPVDLIDYTLCEKAVSNNGLALQFVAEELQDYSLCEKAVLQNKKAIQFIEDNLLLKQIKDKFNLKEYISKEVKKLLKEYYLKEK